MRKKNDSNEEMKGIGIIDNFNIDEIQNGDIIVGNMNDAKKKIGEMLKDYANIDDLAEIILYNTDTYLRFFWSHPESCSYEGMSCTTYYNEKTDKQDWYDCNGDRCNLCPWFSFIPKGFDKFKSCEELRDKSHTGELLNMLLHYN